MSKDAFDEFVNSKMKDIFDDHDNEFDVKIKKIMRCCFNYGRASMLAELRAKVPSRIEIFEASKEITTTMPEMHIIFGAAFVINKIFGGDGD